MELKIRIRTPNGQAGTTLDDWKLKAIQKLLFRKAHIKERYVNKAQDIMYWVVECDVRHSVKISRSIGQYSAIVNGVFNNKTVNKNMKRLADSPEDYKEVRSLIEDGTRIDIVKAATAQELVEAGMTFWQRMKKEFSALKD